MIACQKRVDLHVMSMVTFAISATISKTLVVKKGPKLNINMTIESTYNSSYLMAIIIFVRYHQFRYICSQNVHNLALWSLERSKSNMQLTKIFLRTKVKYGNWQICQCQIFQFNGNSALYHICHISVVNFQNILNSDLWLSKSKARSWRTQLPITSLSSNFCYQRYSKQVSGNIVNYYMVCAI